MNKSLLSIAIALVVLAGSAHAERPARKSFSVDRVHTHGNGGISTRHMEQTATATGFTRNRVKTAPSGATATRNTEVVNDADAGLRTRTSSGTTFAGKAYSGQSTTQRTDDGYLREGTFTGPNGQTAARSADVSIDKDAGTLTKNISVTTPSGNSTTTTVVQRQANQAVGVE